MQIRRCLAPLLLAVFLVLLPGAGRAPAEEFYYMAMFGSQTELPDPDYSHTFAAFVRAWGDGPCPRSFVIEDSFCISWLPADLRIRTRALLPEPGHNFGLHETIRYALWNDERVSMWGPYRIEEGLYYDAVDQVQLLNSGHVAYKTIDSGRLTSRVSNCIHAVSAVAEGHRMHVISPEFGETGSWRTLQLYGPWIIDKDTTHEWVYSYLRLDCYPIIRRDYDTNPRSGIVWSLLKRAAGVEP
jgi:hypothetical protein